MQSEIEAFLAQGKAEGLSASTVTLYRFFLERVAQDLAGRGCRKVVDVTQADLDAVMLTLAESWNRQSRRQAANVVRRFFQSLREQGRLISNPARDLPLPLDRNRPLPPPPLSEAEIHDFIASLPRHNAADLGKVAILELLYGCGLRKSECLSLNLTDVDQSRQMLHVRKSKSMRARILPLMKGALFAVKDYLAVRRDLLLGPDHGALFLGSDGQRMKGQHLQDWFTRVGRRCLGRHVHLHLLRHSIAVHLLRGKADVRYVQEFLGHRQLDTTKIYLRIVPGQLKEAYEQAMPEIAIEPDR